MTVNYIFSFMLVLRWLLPLLLLLSVSFMVSALTLSAVLSHIAGEVDMKHSAPLRIYTEVTRLERLSDVMHVTDLKHSAPI